MNNAYTEKLLFVILLFCRGVIQNQSVKITSVVPSTRGVLQNCGNTSPAILQ